MLLNYVFRHCLSKLIKQLDIVSQVKGKGERSERGLGLGLPVGQIDFSSQVFFFHIFLWILDYCHNSSILFILKIF